MAQPQAGQDSCIYEWLSSSAGGGGAFERVGDDGGARASMTLRVAASQGAEATRAASAQNASGLANRRKRPNASNEGVASKLIEICSLSPPGDRR